MSIAANVALRSNRMRAATSSMEPEFWQQRWHEGRIGFHQDRVDAAAASNTGHRSALPQGSRVFVPLAGKSLDMPWLAAQGHRVLGVELSRIAVEQFFDEHGAAAGRSHESRYGTHYVAGGDRTDLRRCVRAGCGSAAPAAPRSSTAPR